MYVYSIPESKCHNTSILTRYKSSQTEFKYKLEKIKEEVFYSNREKLPTLLLPRFFSFTDLVMLPLMSSYLDGAIFSPRT